MRHGTVQYKPSLGITIFDAADDATALASVLKEPVGMTFNGTYLSVLPYMTTGQVVEAYRGLTGMREYVPRGKG